MEPTGYAALCHDRIDDEHQQRIARRLTSTLAEKTRSPSIDSMTTEDWVKIISSAIIAMGAISATIVAFYLNKKGKLSDGFSGKVIDEGDENGVNDFYQELLRLVRGSCKEIYMTGGGLVAHWESDKELINEYSEAFRSQLNSKKNLQIFRVQIADKGSTYWSEKLGDLVADFPGRFHLFLLRDPDSAHAVHLASIDSDDPKNCCAELMLPKGIEKKPGESGETIGTAIFVNQDKKVASRVKRRIVTLASRATPLNTKAEVLDAAAKGDL